MRNNQPVNDREYVVGPDCIIISRTDDKGVITYINDDFIEVSGFSQDELIGQPHNIVRHPDMPAEAFRDMWATLKQGKPWGAIVKNRRKDGSYYWIKAMATPLSSGGNMSVRTKATPDQIRAATALYAQMRRDPSVLLERGEVRGGALKRFVRRINDIDLSKRLWMSTLASIAVVSLSLWLEIGRAHV